MYVNEVQEGMVNEATKRLQEEVDHIVRTDEVTILFAHFQKKITQNSFYRTLYVVQGRPIKSYFGSFFLKMRFCFL